ARDDGLAQGAGAAPDVEPAQTLGRVEPAQELRRDETAPAAHIGLIRITARPGVTMVGHQNLLLLQLRTTVAYNRCVPINRPSRSRYQSSKSCSGRSSRRT